MAPGKVPDENNISNLNLFIIRTVGVEKNQIGLKWSATAADNEQRFSIKIG
jgi:hypothetical protein